MLQKDNEWHPQSARVLVVDDDPHIRESLGEVLEFAGHAVTTATDGKMAFDLLRSQGFDLMLLDLELPRVSGMDVLRQAAGEFPEVPVIIISGKGTIQTAVEATKLGAYDFLEKPVDAQRALLTVRNALEKALLQRQRDRLLGEARARYQMVGSSPPMQRIYALIDKAAATQSKVLILGESGTGKEVIARAIHLNSRRHAGPFVAVNCAAIPETLIESELFGHEKGAFTGAGGAHRGKFEQADGGTVFLDEIGDMSLMTQAKTLRVLEEGRIERVGGTRPVDVDVRVVAATNKDLEDAMEAGDFREDLYYRLNIITIRVPTLRERREDIPVLVEHFLELFCRENGLPRKKLDPRALVVLLDHDWPGNVRELRNAIERLVVLSEDETIGPRLAQQAIRQRSRPEQEARYDSLREARRQFEREFILKALILHEWRIQDTADALQIDRSHLWKKMKQYGIEQPS